MLAMWSGAKIFIFANPRGRAIVFESALLANFVVTEFSRVE